MPCQWAHQQSMQQHLPTGVLMMRTAFHNISCHLIDMVQNMLQSVLIPLCMEGFEIQAGEEKEYIPGHAAPP